MFFVEGLGVGTYFLCVIVLFSIEGWGMKGIVLVVIL